MDSTEIRAPWLRSAPELAVLGQQFEHDVRAFTQDLLGTGKLTEERAARIANAAVRQAYHERLPPALVLGVMLTENGEFKPKSRSKVGATGLMQIMPRIWVPTLGKKFGRDLRDDATNVRYGVFILGHWARTIPDSIGAHDGWRKALLRYNGCVTGKNTRDCHKYPDVVRRHVERSALASCGGRPFDSCVVSPLVRSMRTEKPKLPPMFAHLAQKPPANESTESAAKESGTRKPTASSKSSRTRRLAANKSSSRRSAKSSRTTRRASASATRRVSRSSGD